MNDVFPRLRRNWQQLRSAPAGERFLRRYEARVRAGPRPLVVPVLIIGAAIGCMAIGIVLTFMPGPAILFFAIAGALLAGESRLVARALDRLELQVRSIGSKVRRWWGRHSRPTHALLIVAGAGVTAALAVGTFRFVF